MVIIAYVVNIINLTIIAHFLAGDCATCDRPEPPTTTTTQPSNDFSSVSSSSRSDIDYGLVSAVITIAVILAMIFVLLVYIIGRLTGTY